MAVHFLDSLPGGDFESRTMLRTGLSRVGSSFKWQPQDGWRITSGSPSEEDNITQSPSQA